MAKRAALFLTSAHTIIDDRGMPAKVMATPTAAGHGMVKITLDGRKILARKDESFRLA